jgi:hypothetical protein
LEPTGLAKHGTTRGLMGMVMGLARQEAAGRVVGRFWNQIDLFFRSKLGPLAGYADALLILIGATVAGTVIWSRGLGSIRPKNGGFISGQGQ